MLQKRELLPQRELLPLRLPKEEGQTCNKEGADWQSRLTRWDRLGCSEWLTDLPMRLLRREKPGCDKWLLPTMRDWLLRPLRRERPGYSLSEWGTDNNRSCRHSSHCYNNLLSSWTMMFKFHAHHMDTLDALRCTCTWDCLVSRFTHILLSVCNVAGTSIHLSYTPRPNTCIAF